MKNSINLYKDILIGVLYLTGMVGLMTGDILFSLVFIGSASLIGNIHLR